VRLKLKREKEQHWNQEACEQVYLHFLESGEEDIKGLLYQTGDEIRKSA
jgi:hypothetical protein